MGCRFDWRARPQQEHREGIPLLLIVIVLVGFGLRMYRSSDAFEGSHGWNESHYAIIAHNFIEGVPLSEPTKWDGGLVYWVPPLFSYLLFLVFFLGGESEVAARAVPSVFSTASLIFVYLFCRMLYNHRVGLTAAAILAVNAFYVLFGRNVQVDAPFVSLAFAAFYFYVKALRTVRWHRNIVVAGLFSGLSVFTKQPALLLIPIAASLEVINWRRRGGHWCLRFFVFSWLSIAFVIPWAVDGMTYHAHSFWSGITPTHGTRAGSFTAQSFDSTVYQIFPPLLWPLVVAGLLVCLVKHDWRSLVLLAWFVPYSGFLVVAHAHEYYSLPIVPACSILIACALDAFMGKLFAYDTQLRGVPVPSSGFTLIYTLIALTLVNASLTHTLDTLYELKYGFGAFREAGRTIAAHPDIDFVFIDTSLTPPYSYYVVPPGIEQSVEIVDAERALAEGRTIACLPLIATSGPAWHIVYSEGGARMAALCLPRARWSFVVNTTRYGDGRQPQQFPVFHLIIAFSQTERTNTTAS